ncbi:hypothetical protein CD351_15360 [Erythrobacter sp. KY5]|uniref:hypothetical protein n=1 Tax=Erythrobacter sp. KY5 TaxID=2011159 RepID=UPI000DBEF478|nr:hypothetical protein [Erythrobacter sp. KY5]AWW75807.1 hypothetical protein CD351_15360 [Erythrobacter sp. KY5]
MSNAAQTITRPPFPPEASRDASLAEPTSVAPVPDSWNELREARDIQFDELTLANPPMPEPREPSWFSQMLRELFAWLGEVLSPIAGFFGESWPVMKWVLLALLVAFVLYLIARNVGLIARRRQMPKSAASEPEWQPSREESAALLEDADALAAQGRFDEATRLLLHRSVSQIAAARPDWVDPSSTARELAALPALPEGARTAFSAISQRVERSLFALRSLTSEDWDAARAAYADFVQAEIAQVSA